MAKRESPALAAHRAAVSDAVKKLDDLRSENEKLAKQLEAAKKAKKAPAPKTSKKAEAEAAKQRDEIRQRLADLDAKLEEALG